MGPIGPAAHRDAGLDVLRAAAALAVLGYHVRAAGGGSLAPLDALFAHGYRGVVVFFVLSGYLVARPFLVRPVGLAGYLVRRGARIMPAYLVALVGVVMITGDHLVLGHPLAYLTLTQNLDPRLLSAGPMAPAWTLHLEACFYLLLPVLMAALLWIAAGRAGVGLSVVAALGSISMLLHVGASISPDPWISSAGRMSLPAMLWAFLPGVGIAWTVTRSPTLAHRLRRPAVGALAVALVGLGWFGSMAFPLGLATQDVSLAIGVALVLPMGRQPAAPDPTTTRRRTGLRVGSTIASGMAWFGRCVSYPFYLWHVPILGLVVAAGMADWAAFGVVGLIGCAIGVASWTIIEAPAMRAAARWSERWSEPTAGQASLATLRVGKGAPLVKHGQAAVPDGSG